MESELATLNDPRSQSKTQQSILRKEAYYQEQLQAEQQRQQEILDKIQDFDKQIIVYTSLDEDIARQETVIKQCEHSYRLYLKNEQEAQRLPEYEDAYQQQLTAVEQTERQLQAAKQAYLQANAAFDEEELQTLRLTITDLREKLVVLGQTMLHNQEKMNKLEAQIAEADKRLIELKISKKRISGIKRTTYNDRTVSQAD